MFAKKSERIVHSLFSTLLSTNSTKPFKDLLLRLKNVEQRKYIDAIIAFAVHQYLPSNISSKENIAIPASNTISGVASLIYGLAENNDVAKEHLVSSLTRSISPSLDESLAARRSVLTALSKDEG